MELWHIAVRALVAYVYLLVTTRASGKRVITQATPFDLVVSLIVGDLIDDALWAEVPMAKFAVAVGTIFFCEAIAALASFHSTRVLHLLNGIPRLVLRDGVEDHDALRREQLNEDDLEHLLRLDGLERETWKDVHLAVMERDHEVSLILMPGAEPAQKQDAQQVWELVR